MTPIFTHEERDAVVMMLRRLAEELRPLRAALETQVSYDRKVERAIKRVMRWLEDEHDATTPD
jgi:hypothetical protein